MTLAWSLVTFALADWPSMAATGILGLFRFGAQPPWHLSVNGTRESVVGPAVEANGARQRTVLVLCFVLFSATPCCAIFLAYFALLTPHGRLQVYLEVNYPGRGQRQSIIGQRPRVCNAFQPPTHLTRLMMSNFSSFSVGPRASLITITMAQSSGLI